MLPKVTVPGLCLTLQSAAMQQLLYIGRISPSKEHQLLAEELQGVNILTSPAPATHAREIKSSQMQALLAQEHVSWH